MSLYLHDARFIDWQTLEITRGHLEVDAGPVVGPDGGIRFVEQVPADAEVIRCDGRLVTKSFAIGHHHIYSALARGMPPPKRTPRTFNEILELIWWNLDRALDADMIRASAQVSAIDAVRCGSTFIIDHHASPAATAGILDIIAAALDDVGVSHLLCYELSDRDGSEAFDAGLAETERHLREHQGLVGLHASFTVSDDSLERAVELAGRFETGVHIHVAEAESDEAHCRETHGCSAAERLRRAGALSSSASLLAHCLHLDDDERALVRESNAWVVHNTQSNQNNGVGRFDPRGLGDRIMIGTDGMHSDMLEGARAMYLEGQGMAGLSPADACMRLRAVHQYLAANQFAGDGANNLLVLDYPTPTPVTPENWPAHVVYSLASRFVRCVISDGRVVFADGKVQTVDEQAVLANAREQAMRLWERL